MSNLGYPCPIDDELGLALFPESWNSGRRILEASNKDASALRIDLLERVRKGTFIVVESFKKQKNHFSEKIDQYYLAEARICKKHPRKSAYYKARAHGYENSLARLDIIYPNIDKLAKQVLAVTEKLEARNLRQRMDSDADDRADLKNLWKSLEHKTHNHYHWNNPYTEEIMETYDSAVEELGPWALGEGSPDEIKPMKAREVELLNFIHSLDPWEIDYQTRRLAYWHLLNGVESLISALDGISA